MKSDAAFKQDSLNLAVKVCMEHGYIAVPKSLIEGMGIELSEMGLGRSAHRNECLRLALYFRGLCESYEGP
jgi:hypothetical protein